MQNTQNNYRVQAPSPYAGMTAYAAVDRAISESIADDGESVSIPFDAPIADAARAIATEVHDGLYLGGCVEVCGVWRGADWSLMLTPPTDPDDDDCVDYDELEAEELAFEDAGWNAGDLEECLR